MGCGAGDAGGTRGHSRAGVAPIRCGCPCGCRGPSMPAKPTAPATHRLPMHDQPRSPRRMPVRSIPGPPRSSTAKRTYAIVAVGREETWRSNRFIDRRPRTIAVAVSCMMSTFRGELYRSGMGWKSCPSCRGLETCVIRGGNGQKGDRACGDCDGNGRCGCCRGSGEVPSTYTFLV